MEIINAAERAPAYIEKADFSAKAMVNLKQETTTPVNRPTIMLFHKIDSLQKSGANLAE